MLFSIKTLISNRDVQIGQDFRVCLTCQPFLVTLVLPIWGQTVGPKIMKKIQKLLYMPFEEYIKKIFKDLYIL